MHSGERQLEPIGDARCLVGVSEGKPTETFTLISE